MASLLYRIGRFSFLRRRWVVGAWAALLAAVATAALGLGGSLTQSFEIPGTESDRAQTMLTERFGVQASAIGSGTGSRTGEDADRPASTRMVVAAPPDQNLLAGGLQTVLAAVAPLARAPGVAAVSDPVAAQAVAPDGSVTYLDVQFTTPADDVAPATLDKVRGAAESLTDQGFEVAVTGGPFTEPLHILSGAEAIGVGVALLVLLVMFGSALAAGIPIVTAAVGVGIGAAGVFAVAATADVSSASLALALMLGLAVGIDYALFLLSRHRQQLSTGLDPLESAARAVGTAGNAVVLAGSTVIVALVALSVVGIPFLTLMGLAAAATVAVAVLVAVTLLPAVLGFAGSRLVPRGRAARDVEHSVDTTNRWGSLVTRYPWVTLGAATMLLGVVALPALDLELGLPDAGSEAESSPARRAHDMLADGFGPGFNGPLVVLVDAAGGDLTAAVGVVSQEVAQLGAAYVAPSMPNPQGDAALVIVVPASAPNTTETTDLVRAIRDLRPGVEAQTGTQMWVTGAAAANVDITQRLADALPQFLLIVVGLAFVLLMIAFRSLLVPLTAVAGFLLALAAALGATVAVFQWGWLADLFDAQPAQLLNFMPIVLVGVLFGLAMDYQVFLVSRMREEYVHGTPPHDAARAGFAHGARVVLAAALIMISVFTSFVFGGETLIAPMAFALAVGIVLDALVIRMCVIPAVMALLGRSAWWLPGWLDRALPDVDLEGSRIALTPVADHVPAEPVGATR